MRYRWSRVRPFTARLIGPPVALGTVDMIRRGGKRGGVGSEGENTPGEKEKSQFNGRKILRAQTVINRPWWDRTGSEGLGPDLDRR